MRGFKCNLVLEEIKFQLQFLAVWKILIFQTILESSVVTSTHLKPSTLFGLNTPQSIEEFGYCYESHVIRTEDNVLLQYFRIPHGKNSSSGYGEPKPVVLLVHGLFGSSIQWFFQDEDKSLPLVLAEEGYDVWLANGRGVSYSKQLQNITYQNTTFWQYSWHEMGVFDLPAAIDYILHVTNQKQLFYIGHSQGTTQLFALLANSTEYNAKIRLMVALAPAVYLGGVRGLAKIGFYGGFFINVFDLAGFLTSLGLGEFFPGFLSDGLQSLIPTTCSLQPITVVCQTVLYSIAGFNYDQFLKEKGQHIFSRFPDTISLRALAHYSQLVVTNKFRKYDHGVLKNLKKYGTYSPPSYNLSQVTAPVAIFWSENDYLVSPKGVARLARDLGNVVLNYRVPYDNFNHLDFAGAKDAYSLVFTEVLRVIKLYL